MNIVLLIILSLFGTILFGLIDASFFLLFENILRKQLTKNKYLDENSIPILISTLAISISLFISSYITKLISTKINLLKHPLIEVIGFAIGKLTIVFLYILYVQYLKKILNKNKNENGNKNENKNENENKHIYNC